MEQAGEDVTFPNREGPSPLVLPPRLQISLRVNARVWRSVTPAMSIDFSLDNNGNLDDLLQSTCLHRLNEATRERTSRGVLAPRVREPAPPRAGLVTHRVKHDTTTKAYIYIPWATRQALRRRLCMHRGRVFLWLGVAVA